jgi:hypothetical protein
MEEVAQWGASLFVYSSTMRWVIALMMEAARTSDTSVDIELRTLQSIPKDSELCTRFWWEGPKQRDHSEDQGVGGKMGSEWILGRLAWRVWIGFDLLSTGTGGGLLWVRWWTFGFLRHGFSYCRVKFVCANEMECQLVPYVWLQALHFSKVACFL